MSQGLFTAVTGIRANQTQLNVVSNNISNLNTVAFKKSVVNFKTLFAQTITAGTRPTSSVGGTNPRQIGNGVTLGEITQNHAQGGQMFTGRQSDFLIEGEGYFTVGRNQTSSSGSNTDSFFLTRAGNFNLDGDSYLVSPDGNNVQGTNTVDGNDPTRIKNIRLPRELVIFKERDNVTNDVLNTWIGDATSAAPAPISGGTISPAAGEATELINFSVAPDGSLTLTYASGDRISVRNEPVAGATRELLFLAAEGGDYAETVDPTVDGDFQILTGAGGTPVLYPEEIQLRLATVTNPSGLLSMGNNNFDLAPNAGDINFGIGATAGRGQTYGGALESSNVEIAQEFTNMIIAQRGIEAASKVVSTQSEVMRTIIGIL